VLFALVVGYELAVDLGPTAARVLTVGGWVIWGAFALELLAQPFLAPDRVRFLCRHWFQVVGLLVPTLRLLRFTRLLRLGRALPAARVVTSSYRVAGTPRSLLRERLAFLAGVSVVAVIAVAEIAFIFEREAPDPAFESFGDAVLRACALVVALQGDPTPTSVGAAPGHARRVRLRARRGRHARRQRGGVPGRRASRARRGADRLAGRDGVFPSDPWLREAPLGRWRNRPLRTPTQVPWVDGLGTAGAWPGIPA
jgi:hypothetical protein